jgi:hypothetical protein
MYRLCKGLVVLLCIAVIAFWLLRDTLLEKTVEQALVSEEPVEMTPGWYLDGVSWQTVGWEGLMNSVMTRGMFEISRVDENEGVASRIQFYIGSLKMLPQTSLAGVSWVLQATDLRALISGRGAFLPGADLPESDKLWQEIWMELDQIRFHTAEEGWSLDRVNPADAFTNWWEQLRKQGYLDGKQELKGRIWIRFPVHVIYFELLSRTEGNRTWMTTREQDMRNAAELFGEALTEAEIALFSRYPLRLPVLFAINDYARNIAFRAYVNDPSLSEPAYRHLLWSYMLTREYGPEFARMVTDAHEVGETGNTPEKSAMDIYNNRVGRELFLEGVAIENLLEIAKKDPRVQRVP